MWSGWMLAARSFEVEVFLEHPVQFDLQTQHWESIWHISTTVKAHLADRKNTLVTEACRQSLFNWEEITYCTTYLEAWYVFVSKKLRFIIIKSQFNFKKGNSAPCYCIMLMGIISCPVIYALVYFGHNCDTVYEKVQSILLHLWC